MEISLCTCKKKAEVTVSYSKWIKWLIEKNNIKVNALFYRGCIFSV